MNEESEHHSWCSLIIYAKLFHPSVQKFLVEEYLLVFSFSHWETLMNPGISETAVISSEACCTQWDVHLICSNTFCYWWVGILIISTVKYRCTFFCCSLGRFVLDSMDKLLCTKSKGVTLDLLCLVFVYNLCTIRSISLM